MKIYNDFNEIRKEVGENISKIVYKYRSWEDIYHKKLLTERQIWFAHPSTLNDKQDLRPPIRFDETEVDTAAFQKKLLDTVPNGASMTPVDRLRVVTQQLALIKEGPPAQFFKANYEDWIKSSHYDQYGLFSVSTDEVNPTMWANYGDNNKGYCLGFDTIKLSEEINCTLGEVEYTNEPYKFSFINEDKNAKELFMKSEDWRYEKEFRYITLRIGFGRDRVFTYSPDSVVEVVIGTDTTDEHQKEITATAQYILGKDIPIYRLKLNSVDYGYIKEKIA